MVLLLGTAPAFGQTPFAPSDDNSHWDGSYRSMGFDFYGVDDFTFIGNTVVAYGGFHCASGHRAPGIAYYDGGSWHPMGTAQDDLAEVTCVVPNGQYLYAGGAFFWNREVPFHNFARWDWRTNQWSDVDGGIRSAPYHRERVNTMLQIGDDLFIAGSFDTAGTIEAHDIARYNLRDHTWHSLGAGMGGDPWGGVYCLTTDGTWLYAGGLFDTVDGMRANSLARWNLRDLKWDALGLKPDSAGPVEIDAIYAYGDSIVVGGQFDSLGGVPATNIIKYDGRWRPFGSLWAQPRAFTVFHGDLLETGESCGIDDCWGTFDRWDGTQWIPVLNHTNPSALHVHNGELYASGGLWIDSQYNHHIGHLELPDSTWIPLDVDSNYGPISEVDYIATVNGKVYASGWHWELSPGSFNGQEQVQTLEELDQGIWKTIEQNGPHSGVQIFSDGASLYAFGDSEQDTRWITTLDRYDEASRKWITLDTISGGGFATNAILFHDSILYLGGIFDSIDGVRGPNVISYDMHSRTWKSVGEGIASGSYFPGVRALAFFNGELIAGGGFDSTTSTVLRFDTSLQKWLPLGAPRADGYIQSMTVSPTGLYVGGKFNLIGGKSIPYLARWDGKEWYPVGPSIDPNWYDVSIETMGMQDDTDLIIGGFFWSIAGVPVSHIARWDGHQWHPLGLGTNERVVAMGITGSDIYIGGYFTTAGDLGVNEFAHWHSSASSITLGSPPILSASIYPNPASSQVSAEVQMAAPGPLAIDLYNTAGMRVASLFDAQVPAGTNYYLLDLPDLALASGAYYLLIRTNGLSVAKPLVFLR